MLLKGGEIQHEGIFQNGKIVGKGYMINFTPYGTISQVFYTENGEVKGVV